MDAFVDGWAAGKLVSDEHALSAEFESLLTESSSLAVRVAYGVLRNQSDAEDVAQEAFVRAYRRFSSLRDRTRFRAWLVRMTWRLALDWKRGARRRDAREDLVGRFAPPIGDAVQDALDRERSTRLWQAIDALPEKFRLVIVLAAIDGHSVKDVSELLALPEGTVKSRLFEARRRLEARLR
jgi:RNA polymerase sigma-70 factor, ECF subfamily